MSTKTDQIKKKCFVSGAASDNDKLFANALVCKRLPVRHKLNGKDYCVLHFPDADKGRTTNFIRVMYQRIHAEDDLEFQYVYFSTSPHFHEHNFTRQVDFNNAIFTEDVDFNRSSFQGETFFCETQFQQNVSFGGCVFDEQSEIHFSRPIFERNADFKSVVYKGYVFFSDITKMNGCISDDTTVDFRHGRLENPRRISFQSCELQPSWFVNVDSREFVFTDISWKNLYWDFQLSNQNIERELQHLEDRGIKDQKKRLFEIAARQLAVNAEENNRYDEAARFRYMAMETRRLEETKRFRASRFLIWLYKWTSGYGESWSWAALIMISLWLLFGLLYWAVGDFGSDNILTLPQALGHSSMTMLLQKTDLHSQSNTTFTLRIIQTILAPLQAALLALAIRRKFMR